MKRETMNSTTGTLIKEYRIKHLATISKIFYAAIIFAVGVGSIYVIHFSLGGTGVMPGTSEATELFETPYFKLIPFLPIGMAIILLIVTLRDAKKRIRLYQNGIGNEESAWTWSDLTYYHAVTVRHYYLFIPVGKTFRCLLIFADGQRIVVDQKFSDGRSLYELILEGVSTTNLENGVYKQ